MMCEGKVAAPVAQFLKDAEQARLNKMLLDMVRKNGNASDTYMDPNHRLRGADTAPVLTRCDNATDAKKGARCVKGNVDKLIYDRQVEREAVAEHLEREQQRQEHAEAKQHRLDTEAAMKQAVKDAN